MTGRKPLPVRPGMFLETVTRVRFAIDCTPFVYCGIGFEFALWVWMIMKENFL